MCDQEHTNSIRSKQDQKAKPGEKPKKPTQAQRIKDLESENERLEKQSSDFYEFNQQNLDLDGAIGWVLPEENRKIHIRLWALEFNVDVKTVTGWIKENSIIYYGPSASNCYVYTDDMMAGLKGVHSIKKESDNEKTQ